MAWVPNPQLPGEAGKQGLMASNVVKKGWCIVDGGWRGTGRWSLVAHYAWKECLAHCLEVAAHVVSMVGCTLVTLLTGCA